MERQYDSRTGRPLIDGQYRIDVLTDDELEAEVTIASVHPQLRAERLDALLLERARRRREPTPVPA